MPNFGMLPLQGTLLALATQTTSGTSAVVTMPQAEGYRIFLECDTVSGTSPTLDVWLATSADGGTTYQNVLKFAQVTTTGGGRVITFRPYLGIGDAAAEAASNVFALADGATGSGTAAANGPIDPAKCKIRWVAGGTTPSFAFAVKYLAVSQG